MILTNSYGRVRIKGLESDRYLCFDKRGHLISKVSFTQEVLFVEGSIFVEGLQRFYLLKGFFALKPV